MLGHGITIYSNPDLDTQMMCWNKWKKYIVPVDGYTAGFKLRRIPAACSLYDCEETVPSVLIAINYGALFFRSIFRLSSRSTPRDACLLNLHKGLSASK